MNSLFAGYSALRCRRVLLDAESWMTNHSHVTVSKFCGLSGSALLRRERLISLVYIHALWRLKLHTNHNSRRAILLSFYLHVPMPRLSRALLLRAYNISPLLPLVLRETRTLSSAINELRWLREYVDNKTFHHHTPRQKSKTLLKLCQRRARGEPLQYLLGTQPFGELEIKCKPGVLIPRQD